MKFYVTGRSSNYSLVECAVAAIKERGHEITFEWTSLPMVKPYSENIDKATAFAQQGVSGVIDADVYIIFVHDDGNGVFTEFGAALAANTIQGTPTIYAIGTDKSAAMFNYHPAIKWRSDVEAILNEVSK
mgnify:CR=1 FL=1|tara:strand:+ start:2197 stop:2586 length:390 start_codon:yes stop_codon:yes gene_type:complete